MLLCHCTNELTLNYTGLGMDRTELAARARLAEQAERYEDMASYMKKVTLSAKEGLCRNLYSRVKLCRRIYYLKVLVNT